MDSSLAMLEAHCQVNAKNKGKKRQIDTDVDTESTPMSIDPIAHLQHLVESPPDQDFEFTLIKKDIFHAFHMLPIPINHGLRPVFLRSLRDHILRWDPVSRNNVEQVCKEKFNLTFDQMLSRNPRFIAERTPQFVPPPSVLVPAIEHVYKMFENGVDAKTGVRLFNTQFRIKATALLDLARQGYLSDVQGVPMYEKAGIDKYGLQKWKCLRGTNHVEGGPHGDIYRKFGALHAGPRLSTNSLTDHRTWYNLQAYVQHLFGVDWDYHHNLSMINRTAFLLNYLSDVVEGSKSYSEWINGDLYERTEEQFGICQFPETLRVRLSMEPYSDSAALAFKLSRSDDWLRKRQNLALPALPPTTPEARQYYFSKIREFSESASANNRKHVDYEAFAQEWNHTADGKECFYVTFEVLAAYAKGWEKTSNIRASEEMMPKHLEQAKASADTFSASSQPFPSYITAKPLQIYPSKGVVPLDNDDIIPGSLSTDLPTSRTIGTTANLNHPLPILSPQPSSGDNRDCITAGPSSLSHSRFPDLPHCSSQSPISREHSQADRLVQHQRDGELLQNTFANGKVFDPVVVVRAPNAQETVTY